MFVGGVTRRFPGLNISFLEGGSGWACMLYGDLLSHWEKRSLEGLEEVDPRNLDRAVLADLAGKDGGEAFVAALRERDGRPYPGDGKAAGGGGAPRDSSLPHGPRHEEEGAVLCPPFPF